MPARARIPAADVTVEPEAWLSLCVGAAGNENVLVDDRGGLQHVRTVDATDARFQIDKAAIAESGHRFSGFRIQRHQTAIGDAQEQPRPQRPVTRPVHNAPPRDLVLGVVPPDLLASLRLQGEHARTAAQIHHAVDHDRRDLKVRDAGVERPRGLQLADVLWSDLRRRVSLRPGSRPNDGQSVSVLRCGAAPITSSIAIGIANRYFMIDLRRA